MTARQVFDQKDGEVTKAYYRRLAEFGRLGEVAVCLFRCQKRSTAAKSYRRGKFRQSAYDVKSWSMGELCRILGEHSKELGIQYGWKEDQKVVFGDTPSWVLYVDLPFELGQVSFHSPCRLIGPPYHGEWDGLGMSEGRILAFCDSVTGTPAKWPQALQPVRAVNPAEPTTFDFAMGRVP